MKKIQILIALCAFTFILQSCKKDQAFIEDPLTQNEPELFRKRSCGMEGHMHGLLEDPTFRKKHETKFRKMESMAGRKFAMRENQVLPMAVHFQGVSNPDISCLRQLAKSQIDILNNDYRGTNSDITDWTNNASNSFPGIEHGAAGFKFCLANKNHPSGYGLSDGDLAVTVNATNGDTDSKWSGYINIFVQYNTGVLGYSPLGGAGDGDGVVIDASAFGSGSGCGSIKPDAPYNLGRTLTHELGHYLLLDHIWGNGCGTDDLVADTPDSADPYYDCPNLGASSCGSTDMHMNYMDYTNDACMYMFSAGQVTRSTNYIGTSLASVMDNAANVCSEVDGGGDDNGGNDNGGDNGDNGGDDNGDNDVDDNDGNDNGGDDGTTPEGCVAPTTFEQGETDANHAVLTWEAIPDATRYSVQFRAKDATSWYTIGTQTNSIDLTSLAPETDYIYRVRTICGSERASWSARQNFRTGNHGCDPSGTCSDTPVFLDLKTDDYGSEVTWELADASGTILFEGGGYDDVFDGEIIQEELCLEDGCYTFTVNDAFGDGICCDFGDGYFQLLSEDGSVLAASDGNYGEFTSVEICVGQSNRNGKSAARGKRKVAPKDPAVVAHGRATKRLR